MASPSLLLLKIGESAISNHRPNQVVKLNEGGIFLSAQIVTDVTSDRYDNFLHFVPEMKWMFWRDETYTITPRSVASIRPTRKGLLEMSAWRMCECSSGERRARGSARRHQIGHPSFPLQRLDPRLREAAEVCARWMIEHRLAAASCSSASGVGTSSL
jgi:hypothetical protein